jgi:acetyl-CoA carboxylase carboxyl transferase subunit beta
MAWFKKSKKPKPIREERQRSSVPEGLWVKCEGCKEVIYSRDLDRNLRVCPKCEYHMRIDARTRIALLLDEPEPRELFAGVSPTDPLGFRDSKRYRDRIKTYQQAIGERDAVIVVQGHLEQIPVVRWCWPRWSTGPWAAPWDRWWARRSRAAPSAPWSATGR